MTKALGIRDQGTRAPSALPRLLAARSPGRAPGAPRRDLHLPRLRPRLRAQRAADPDSHRDHPGRTGSGIRAPVSSAAPCRRGPRARRHHDGASRGGAVPRRSRGTQPAALRDADGRRDRRPGRGAGSGGRRLRLDRRLVLRQLCRGRVRGAPSRPRRGHAARFDAAVGRGPRCRACADPSGCSSTPTPGSPPPCARWCRRDRIRGPCSVCCARPTSWAARSCSARCWRSA